MNIEEALIALQEEKIAKWQALEKELAHHKKALLWHKAALKKMAADFKKANSDYWWGISVRNLKNTYLAKTKSELK